MLIKQGNNISSSIFLSAEIRWFLNGNIPLSLHKWFRDSVLKYVQKAKADTYLIYPNARTVGVKFRDDKFEIKSLVKKLGQYKINNNAQGIIELWEKWSMGGNSINQFLKEATKLESSWLNVKKTRTIRKFSADITNLEEVDASGEKGFPDDGCNVELTKIEINEKLYWSFGFEAFSKKKDLRNNLLQTIELFFKELDIELSLPLENSYSYPTFFQKIR